MQKLLNHINQPIFILTVKPNVWLHTCLQKPTIEVLFGCRHVCKQGGQKIVIHCHIIIKSY